MALFTLFTSFFSSASDVLEAGLKPEFQLIIFSLRYLLLGTNQSLTFGRFLPRVLQVERGDHHCLRGLGLLVPAPRLPRCPLLVPSASSKW